MTPKGHKVMLSSLGICTVSWLFPVDGNTAHAASVPYTDAPPNIREEIVEEAFYRYYNPFASLDDMTRPLETSDEPIDYRIKQGDTLSEIADEFDVPLPELAAFNDIVDVDLINAGQTLKIPYQKEEVRVKPEDDLSRLAQKYDVSETLIEQLNPKLAHINEDMYVGQIVTVPKRIKVKKRPPTKKEHSPRIKEKQSVQLASRSANTAKTTETAQNSVARLAWPVSGQITSRYGSRGGDLHRGIDIWNAQEGQTPIKAAASGVVARAGYAGSYGNLIVIDHGGGVETYYAHLRDLHVSKGQEVGAGQQVGYMGKTGNSTGFHLHFEVRQNGQNIDPLHALP